MATTTVVLILAFIVTCFGFPNYKNFDAGSRIVGGSNAADGQFPYQASIRRSSNGQHNCGGSILNSRWILTAAHCLDGTSESDWFIHIGSVFQDVGGTHIQISRMIIHEDYTDFPVRNDVALLELSQEIQFSDNVQPIELETGDIGSVNAVVSGWGLLESGGSLPNHLQYIFLQTLTVAECQALWGANLIGNDEICTMGTAGQGVCSADSGGPLVVNGRQIGVVSWGTWPCGGGVRPDVYARVSSFVGWIEANMNN